VLPIVLALRAVKIDGAPVVALHTAHGDAADWLSTSGAKPVPIVFEERQRFHWSSGSVHRVPDIFLTSNSPDEV
jgi:hypothetical protein